jgi:hypothetical protein
MIAAVAQALAAVVAGVLAVVTAVSLKVHMSGIYTVTS